MIEALTGSLPPAGVEVRTLADYGKGVPRWCDGCGDNSILAALQRLCRDEHLDREKVMCVSGIGCSSRFPHYMNTYGFHSLHGRALPVAEGIRIRRPDLTIFVNTGDGDCCSIGTSHWIHAIRYNMDMTVMMHDNGIYGLTKMQASPTSPIGLKTNTSPRGAVLKPLNPLVTTLGVENVSFVAQAVDWLPQLSFEILSQAFHHKGFSFIRILQRCPNYLPKLFDPWVKERERTFVLVNDRGIPDRPEIRELAPVLEHDPSDIHRAREIASGTDPVPVGILYRNDEVPCYEDLRRSERVVTADEVRRVLDAEFDKFSVKTSL
ncbi:MAG: thiamine pyrophosphate-dependent enzyme [Planctomycetes bacterium]|jgi:2-oxoglutarate ferredoxin oxidoreductase subunit beta|nr:thiamine pyrophosphate-dependent enzyme [Planctomycetota bacterium]